VELLNRVTAPNLHQINIQVAGVDEADIIKTDGEFIYIVSGNKVIIVKAYPPEEAQVVSEIKLDGYISGIFVNGDKLAVLEGEQGYWYEDVIRESDMPPYIHEPSNNIEIYDISDRSSPLVTRSVTVDGQYLNSRLIGDYIYVIITNPVYRINDEVSLPKIQFEDTVKEIPATEIYYSDDIEYSSSFTTIAAINIENDDEEPNYETILLGAATTIYASLDNIYITFQEWNEADYQESTAIHRVNIDGSEIVYVASGKVPGRLLNQFSMDEYQDYFRVATTLGNLGRTFDDATSENNVYILDMDLDIVGKVENLAPGEQIYSARFMGERCYLVTFRQIDPLFVIDLGDPYYPEVLGQLKITGYSDYLHPYDSNHIIGIGKETVTAEQGDFAWYQGVKISLFDVSDVANPLEIDKIEIGDRGTDSPVLHDHKAFLFDQARNLLAMPVMVYEIDESQYPYGVPPNAYGEPRWQGAFVFDISIDEGIEVRGTITHGNGQYDPYKMDYYFDTSFQIKRTLYIGDVLYTISDSKIKMNDLTDLTEINEVELLTN
jgi:uncharacterized secreted protein with C-terminal beta-propeller domain